MKNWSKEIFAINSALKTNPWTYKITSLLCTALKAGFDKLGINKLADVPTDLNNIKNIENLDIGKLKSVPKDLKNLSNVVSKENLKTTKLNKLNVKVTNGYFNWKQNPNASTLIQSNNKI